MNLSRILLTTAALVIASAAGGCEGSADVETSVEVSREDGGDAEDREGGRSSDDADGLSDTATEDADPTLTTRDGGRFPNDGQPLPPRDGDICPASTPQHGTECHAMATCAYDGRICTCPHHGQGTTGRAWSCFTAPVQVDAGACPGSQPRSHGVCAIEGLNCRYGRVQCFCGGSSNADDAVWDCR